MHTYIHIMYVCMHVSMSTDKRHRAYITQRKIRLYQFPMSAFSKQRTIVQRQCYVWAVIDTGRSMYRG